jgi:hypothetical protein
VPAPRPRLAGPPGRVVFVRVSLLLVSLLLPLLGLELALRVFGPILPGNYSTGYYLTADPAYGRFHVRGFSGWTRTAEYTTHIRTNSLGLRGPEIALPKPGGLFRVLALGDSFVEAAQVPEEHSLTQRLEQSLNQQRAGRRFEVLNAGVGGWGTAQELLYLRREGLALQPDLVLLVLYSGNDIANNSPRIERQDVLDTPYKPYFELDGPDGLRELPHQERAVEASERGLWLARGSAVFNFVESGFFDKFKYRDLDVVGNQGDVGKPVLLAKYPPEWEESWQVTERLLAQAARESEAAGARFVVVLAPSTFQIMPEDWRDLVRSSRRPARDWDQDKPSGVMADIASRRGLAHVDLLPALRAARDNGSPPLYFDRDKHWTAVGHSLVAAEIERQLRGLGYLP